MKKRSVRILAIALMAPFYFNTYADDKIEKVKALATTFKTWGANPVIVAAVKEENAKGKPLDAIKVIDEKWKNSYRVDEFMKSLMTNSCAKELEKLMSGKTYFSEAFVMDNLGANVCMTSKTSDYWQGDEAKWIESFKDGVGAIYYGNLDLDRH